MLVINELARRENGRHELGAVNHRIKAALKQANEILAAVATQAARFLIITTELALADAAVIAFEFLLRAKLDPVIGKLAARFAVLTRLCLALVERGFRAPPQVTTHAAVDFMLCVRTFLLAHF